MKIKKTLYPKTKRIGVTPEVIITEKLDGSNLGFFKVAGQLIIAQRNYIFNFRDIEEEKKALYRGLYQWLKDHGEKLEDALHEGSGLFGEWLGMGCIKYPHLSQRFYMFAKTNINEDLEAKNIYYNPELFIYPFIDQVIPPYIATVPVVDIRDNRPSIEELDAIYDSYRGERDCEGFVVSDGNSIRKYVRMKNGKIEPHKS